MLHLFKSKVFLLILATLVLLVVMGVTSKENSKLNWFGNLLNSALSPIQKVLSVSGQKVDYGVSFFGDTKVIKDENEKLKAKIDQLEKENNELKEFREKNNELREALNLKNQFNQYEVLGANIIAKDAGNWFNIFTIDRGSNDGIVKNGIAISSKGLVGRVSAAGIFSSKIISIIDVDSTVSGRLTKSRDEVLIKGDLSLKDQGLCKMEYISPDTDISVGDKVETSGLGGIFPKGITIGKVKEVRQVNSELNRYAIIEPVVDFKRLEEVYILKNKTN